MEALECIKTRRSVRKFTEETVTREQLTEVVAAAAYAPSWKNTQTVRYNAVLNKEKIASLANDCQCVPLEVEKLPSRSKPERPVIVVRITSAGACEAVFWLYAKSIMQSDARRAIFSLSVTK